jgi:hypothetical protein
MATGQEIYDAMEQYTISEEVLQLPEATVNDYDTPLTPLRRPTIDVLWNA